MNLHHSHFSRQAHAMSSTPKTIEAKALLKQRSLSIPDLINKAKKRFHKFIRTRDANGNSFRCISCGKILPISKMQAGHFYSAGKYPPLRFNPDNVNGQCGFYCNKMLSGNLNEYRKGLIIKIGLERVAKLDMISEDYKRSGFKWDRFSLIEIIERYSDYK